MHDATVFTIPLSGLILGGTWSYLNLVEHGHFSISWIMVISQFLEHSLFLIPWNMFISTFFLIWWNMVISKFGGTWSFLNLCSKN